MKPFNLERALAGDPVVSRGGGKIESLRRGAVDEITLLVGNFEGDFFDFFWTEDGRFVFTEGEEVDHQNDLFMASTEWEE